MVNDRSEKYKIFEGRFKERQGTSNTEVETEDFAEVKTFLVLDLNCFLQQIASVCITFSEP